jgi:putative ABC transport system permease protein
VSPLTGAWGTDLRQAFRAIQSNRRFALLVCGIMALAIAASTVVFSIVEIIFLPSVVGNTERLGWVFGIDTRRANDRAGISIPDYLAFRDRTSVFEALAARTGGTLTLTGRGQASRLVAMRVSANHLDVWALRPIRGRTFRDGEDLPGAPRVVVLSHRMWQTRLGGEESIVGGALTLDGVPHTVIGILGPHVGVGAFSSIDLWAPLELGTARTTPRDSRVLGLVGLLKAGVSVEQAHQEIHAVALQLQSEFPSTNGGWDARVVDTRTGRTAPQTYYNLALLSVGGALVLLIGCVNVALLLLARGIARQKEFGIRLALGATWLRVARQQALEGLLMALPAGLLGLALAVALIRPLKNRDDGFYSRIAMDWHLFAVAAALALLTPIVFAILPALQLGKQRARLTTGAWTETETGVTGRRRQRMLATTQLGAALMLLIASGLVLRSLIVSIRADLGFSTRDLLTAGLNLPAWKYPDRDRLPQFFGELVDRISTLPGVTSAAAISSMPALQLAGPYLTVTFEGEPPRSDLDRPSAQLATATPAAFETLGVPVIAGREFSRRDGTDAPLVVLVSRQFALRHVSKAEEILGRKLTIRGEPNWRQIVGVVGNVKVFSDDAFPPYVYLPHAQDPQRTMFLLVRMPGRLSATIVNQAISDADPDVAPYQMRTIDDGLQTQMAPRLILFGLFGGLAAVSALLAAFGLFGVFSCFVAQRSREFGIRLALGSTAGELGQMIFREGWRTMAPGLVIGVAGGAFLARYAVGAIYGVTANPYDPVVYGGCIALLLASGTAALWIPAQRAKRVRVTDLLRG